MATSDWRSMGHAMRRRMGAPTNHFEAAVPVDHPGDRLPPKDECSYCGEPLSDIPHTHNGDLVRATDVREHKGQTSQGVVQHKGYSEEAYGQRTGVVRGSAYATPGQLDRPFAGANGNDAGDAS